MSPEIAELIARIHDAPPQMVFNFAGAGAKALYWLHAVAGSSRTLLEATDRYSPTSLAEAVGFMPERFTAPEVARALAEQAYTRAQALAPGKAVFGVGLTATIATDRPKRGEHRCRLAVRDPLGTSHYALTLDKGARTREAEEELVSLLALRAIATASGLLFPPELPLTPREQLDEGFTPLPELQALAEGELSHLTLYPDGRLAPEALPAKALLSGSFNPLHAGHRALAQVASEQLKQPVAFELPLVNADKAALKLAELRRRAAQFLGVAPLVLSRAPRFSDKAALYPGVTFIVGADTASRLVEARFYGGEAGTLAALEQLAQAGNRFLVAARDGRTLDDIAIPSRYRELFMALPEAAFTMAISSSEIRRRHGQA